MDRAEAIQWFEDKIKTMKEPLPKYINSASGMCQWMDMTERFVMVYSLAISALREQEQSKWISIDERLPERKDANPYESVLAIHKDDGFARSWIFDVVAEYSQEFTHWMPIPEPPKEGAEG